MPNTLAKQAGILDLSSPSLMVTGFYFYFIFPLLRSSIYFNIFYLAYVLQSLFSILSSKYLSIEIYNTAWQYPPKSKPTILFILVTISGFLATYLIFSSLFSGSYIYCKLSFTQSCLKFINSLSFDIEAGIKFVRFP